MLTWDYLKLSHLSFDKTMDSIQEYDYYTSWNSLKNQLFVSAIFHSSRRGFAPEANVAAIGRPNMAYLNVEKKS